MDAEREPQRLDDPKKRSELGVAILRERLVQALSSEAGFFAFSSRSVFGSFFVWVIARHRTRRLGPERCFA